MSCLRPARRRWAVRSPSLQLWLTPCLWICAGSCDSELSCRLGLSSSGGVKRGCGDRVLITAALYIHLQATWKLPRRREKKKRWKYCTITENPPLLSPVKDLKKKGKGGGDVRHAHTVVVLSHSCEQDEIHVILHVCVCVDKREDVNLKNSKHVESAERWSCRKNEKKQPVWGNDHESEWRLSTMTQQIWTEQNRSRQN